VQQLDSEASPKRQLTAVTACKTVKLHLRSCSRATNCSDMVHGCVRARSSCPSSAPTRPRLSRPSIVCPTAIKPHDAHDVSTHSRHGSPRVDLARPRGHRQRVQLDRDTAQPCLGPARCAHAVPQHLAPARRWNRSQRSVADLLDGLSYGLGRLCARRQRRVHFPRYGTAHKYPFLV
jgi:hypothetical protein